MVDDRQKKSWAAKEVQAQTEGQEAMVVQEDILENNVTPELLQERTRILQEELKQQCETLLIFIEVRFPELLQLAQERLPLIQKTEKMHSLFLHIGLAENLHEVEMHLMNIT
jgi:hypothetical protein